MLEVTINGTSRSLPEGLTIHAALLRLGVRVPSICTDQRLKPAGDCRLCLVQVAGLGQPVPSCLQALEAGMRIETHTPELENYRRGILEMLAQHCSPESAQALPEKEFHELLLQYGVPPANQSVAGAATVGEAVQPDESHPYIRLDLSQCIACWRCVRICEDVQGQSVWHVVGRGADSHVVYDRGTQFSESSCVSCGACVDTCPTAALVDKVRLESDAAKQWTRSTCVYCGVGCELRVGTRDGQIVAVAPELASPVSKGHLCVKGRYAWKFGGATDRVTRPLVRRQGTWQPASWPEALGQTARELHRLIATHGPDCIGVLGSARATNEDNYFIQKFARLVVGTNNVDCCARVCHTPTAAAMKRMLGTGAATNSFDDIEQAQSFLIVGANPTENHPIVGARIKQRARAGVPLVVIDPRRTELAELAAVHLAPRPGTNVPLMHALANVILEEGLFDTAFTGERVEGLGDFRSFIEVWTPQRAATICGVPPEAIRAAARVYAARKPAMCFHGLGVTEHLQGTEGVMTLINLALLTGNIGKVGAGINPLRGQNNVQGAAVMGCEPANLTGSVALDEARARFETAWGAAIPGTTGLNLMQMIDAAAAGRLKALYVVGYDVLLTLANTAAVRAALQQLELVVVQDLFMNTTAQEFGTVFLPAASVFEKDGTFMNAERRIQRVRQAIAPPEEARADWQIVRELAAAMGAADYFRAGSPEAIWNEIREVWPAVAGITYPRLESAGLQWPCRDERDPGTTVLHAKSFAVGLKARLASIDYVPTDEHCSPQFPLLLTTGRNLYQFNAGTMTRRTRNQELRPQDTLDMSRADALRLGLASGDRVRVISHHGEVTLALRISAAVKAGELFTTFHDPERFVNRLTSGVRDRLVGAPEYKVTAVRIERAYP
jgi:formate dehydrogenase major subunit